MDPEFDAAPDSQVERLLQASRPAPDQRWERELERSLVSGRGRRVTWRRPALAATALTAVLALSTVAVGLVTGGAGGAGEVTAEPKCEWVKVTKVENVRRLVVDDRGEPKVVTQRRPVTRAVKRCR